MRWTRRCRVRNRGSQGGFPVSGRRRTDERYCCVRRSRVVLTPRRWRQVRGCCVGPTGRGYNVGSRATVANKPGHRGERRNPLKPLRAGMPGDSGVLVVTRVPSITIIAHEAAGAAGIRHSPRPRLGREINQQLGRFAPREREAMFGIGADPVIPGRCQRVRAKRGPMTGSASNPES
jgi:hypothetical protein